MNSGRVDLVKMKDGRAAKHSMFIRMAEMMKMMSMNKAAMPAGDDAMKHPMPADKPAVDSMKKLTC